MKKIIHKVLCFLRLCTDLGIVTYSTETYHFSCAACKKCGDESILLRSFRPWEFPRDSSRKVTVKRWDGKAWVQSST